MAELYLVQTANPTVLLYLAEKGNVESFNLDGRPSEKPCGVSCYIGCITRRGVVRIHKSDETAALVEMLVAGGARELRRNGDTQAVELEFSSVVAALAWVLLLPVADIVL